jgi:hypothetical protein
MLFSLAQVSCPKDDKPPKGLANPLGGQVKLRFILAIGMLILVAPRLSAHSANKVFFETLQNGHSKVTINYTVPGLREFRQASVTTPDRKRAEKIYWDLVQGADFFIKNGQLVFSEPNLKAVPW